MNEGHQRRDKIRVYKNTALLIMAVLLSIIKVVNCRIGSVSQANLQLPRDTITGSLAQLPLDNIG